MFYPLPVIRSFKEKKRTQKILLLLSSENLKKNPYTKMEYYDEQNINCAWRDTLYLLHSWSFWFEDSIIIHATKCFWSHATSRGLFKNSSFATSSNRRSVSLIEYRCLQKKMCVFEKIIMLLFCQLKYCRGIKLYHDMWKMFFFSIWGYNIRVGNLVF